MATEKQLGFHVNPPGFLPLKGAPDDGEISDSRLIAGVALGGRAGAFDIVIQDGRISSLTRSVVESNPEWLALPAFVNMHAHADRAFVATERRPASLEDAIRQAKLESGKASSEDIRLRARRLFQRAAAHGTMRIRTHTDVSATIGMRAIDGVHAAAADMKAFIDVEMVAFASAASDPAGTLGADLLIEAIRRGATVIGAVPAMYEQPWKSVEAVLDLATRLDVAVDLHLDEHLDPEVALLDMLATATLERGLHGRVAVSHACALSMADADTAKCILEKMARVNMTLAVLPELNLYLQERGCGSPRRRGLPPVLEAIRAGVAVRLGTDNVRDWFFPYGDADILETGYVAALAAHLDAPNSLMAALCDGHERLEKGQIADLVLIHASSLDDALARRPADRVLIRRGRQVNAPADSGGNTRSGDEVISQGL